MFKFTGETDLLAKTIKPIQKLIHVEDLLCKRFYGLEKPIHGLILAAASSEPLLFLGPPGTAKSRLIRAFCELVGVERHKESKSGEGYYFEYLLTQFTEPSELFGYLNLKSITETDREIRRDEDGMMQHAEVVFLDEIFNASSAILNSLLAFINERRYHDRGRVVDVKMKTLFAASNNPPSGAELNAIYDRFVLRCPIINVHSEQTEVERLVNAGWQDTYGSRFEDEDVREGLLDELQVIPDEIDAATKNGDLIINPGEAQLFARLTQFIGDARQLDPRNMSNRRIIKFVRLILIEAMIDAIRQSQPKIEVQPSHMQILVDFALNPGAESRLERLSQHIGNGS